MRLTVKPLKNRDPGNGMAVVDRDALDDLGLSSGDFVRIEGRGGTATVARSGRATRVGASSASTASFESALDAVDPSSDDGAAVAGMADGTG